MIARTLFHSSNLSLTKGFWAIYWARIKGEFQRCAYQSCWKCLGQRRGISHRNSLYRLSEVVEFDDALVGGKRPRKRRRGAKGKIAVVVAYEDESLRARYLAMKKGMGRVFYAFLPYHPTHAGSLWLLWVRTAMPI